MNSATLTKAQRAPRNEPDPVAPAESSGLAPWSFFIIAALVTAIAAVVLLRGRPPAALGLIIFSIAAAGVVGFAALRLLAPLAGIGSAQGPTVHGRARAALERDKALTLRAIKELEFDRAMGKVAEPDFQEMRGRLRQRAMRLMRQLEGGEVYKTFIERDLAALSPDPPVAPVAPGRTQSHPVAPVAPVAPDTCLSCGTVNDQDARFCKQCGHKLV
jgi:zinc ribbon protein